jgi:hypothetical protein
MKMNAITQSYHQLAQQQQQQTVSPSPVFFNQSNILHGFVSYISSYIHPVQYITLPISLKQNHPPAFEDDHSRSLVFNRIFGPVANVDGTVEVRLHEGIRVLITLDQSILVLNPKSHVRAAISGDLKFSAMEHSNGKVYQQSDRVDIVAYDGTHRNKFV